MKERILQSSLEYICGQIGVALAGITCDGVVARREEGKVIGILEKGGHIRRCADIAFQRAELRVCVENIEKRQSRAMGSKCCEPPKIATSRQLHIVMLMAIEKVLLG